MKNYTLERDGRELQRKHRNNSDKQHYTLERDGRELQPFSAIRPFFRNYTLERDGRELQRQAGSNSGYSIIPLREMEGNYNAIVIAFFIIQIIPLREMEGNYNFSVTAPCTKPHYTLERDGRELQPNGTNAFAGGNYTLERDGRELQL